LLLQAVLWDLPFVKPYDFIKNLFLIELKNPGSLKKRLAKVTIPDIFPRFFLSAMNNEPAPFALIEQ